MNTNVQCTISLLRKLGHEVATEVHSTGSGGRDPNMYGECVASPLLDVQQVLLSVRTTSRVTTKVRLVRSGLRKADQIVPGRGKRGGLCVVRVLNVRGSIRAVFEDGLQVGGVWRVGYAVIPIRESGVRGRVRMESVDGGRDGRHKSGRFPQVLRLRMLMDNENGA